MPQQAKKRTKHEVSRDKTISLIKDATTDLFVERGYHNCHIEAIARALGMTKGAVYHYFASKDEIILALLQDIDTRILAGLERKEGNATTTATQRLLAFLHAQAAYAVQNPKAFTMLVLCSFSFAGADSPIAEQVRTIFKRQEKIIEEILTEGVASGEFSRDIVPATSALGIVGAYGGNVVAWQRSGFDPAVGRALVVEMRAMILARIRPA
ncbi:MAG: TetR/AcrR family transcriptional regulator [Paracoccaceae bacterium]|nr:TetR/AcrR family transcriptional regulator [Paracoccaceae bacterium]